MQKYSSLEIVLVLEFQHEMVPILSCLGQLTQPYSSHIWYTHIRVLIALRIMAFNYFHNLWN